MSSEITCGMCGGRFIATEVVMTEWAKNLPPEQCITVCEACGDEYADLRADLADALAERDRLEAIVESRKRELAELRARLEA